MDYLSVHVIFPLLPDPVYSHRYIGYLHHFRVCIMSYNSDQSRVLTLLITAMKESGEAYSMTNPQIFV